jgi:hypothetical protein
MLMAEPRAHEFVCMSQSVATPRRGWQLAGFCHADFLPDR